MDLQPAGSLIKAGAQTITNYMGQFEIELKPGPL